LIGDSLLSTSIRWGAAFLTLAAAWLWAALFLKRKKVPALHLVSGTYCLLYLFAAGTSLAFPALSYIFIWPLLAGLLALFFRLLPGSGTASEPGWPVFLLELAAGVLAVLLFVPGVLMAILSIDIRSIYFVPLFVAAWLGFLLLPLEVFFSGMDPSGRQL